MRWRRPALLGLAGLALLLAGWMGLTILANTGMDFTLPRLR